MTQLPNPTAVTCHACKHEFQATEIDVVGDVIQEVGKKRAFTVCPQCQAQNWMMIDAEPAAPSPSAPAFQMPTAEQNMQCSQAFVRMASDPQFPKMFYEQLMDPRSLMATMNNGADQLRKAMFGAEIGGFEVALRVELEINKIDEGALKIRDAVMHYRKRIQELGLDKARIERPALESQISEIDPAAIQFLDDEEALAGNVALFGATAETPATSEPSPVEVGAAAPGQPPGTP